jgi:hypothetical protein
MSAEGAAPPDPVRDLLRHTLATLAYRGGKVLRGAPPEFSSFRAAEGTRTPGQVLAHIGDLLDWAHSLASGAHVWKETPPGAWDGDVERFFAGLKRFDDDLASPNPLGFPPGKLFQGPIADALAHVGQIALMRRMAGAPVRGENYFKADIAAGRVGAGQSPPRFEFD